jgi:hypothetical protein
MSRNTTVEERRGHTRKLISNRNLTLTLIGVNWWIVQQIEYKKEEKKVKSRELNNEPSVVFQTPGYLLAEIEELLSGTAFRLERTRSSSSARMLRALRTSEKTSFIMLPNRNPEIRNLQDGGSC